MKRLVAIAATLTLPACGFSGISATSPAYSSAVASTGSHSSAAPLLRRNLSPITHVIIVIQENRTTDNLFQGLPGADTQSYGLDSNGNQVPLHSVPLEWDGDISHSHTNFVTECNPVPSNQAICQMNGWNHAKANGTDCPVSGNDYCPYAYVPQSESQPYFDMAAEFAFGDRMFETNEGPSFPAHQELISGTASSAPQLPRRQISANPEPKHSGGGCDSAPGTTVETIRLKPIGSREGKPQVPCFDRPTLGDLLTSASVSWRYYQCGTGAGLWHAYDAIEHIWDGGNYSTLVIPEPQQILSDIGSNSLAAVSWVTPDGTHSDHPGLGNSGGPSWVAAIVNAVGESPYWNSTAIIVTWDDWGGWYDHVTPHRRDNYNLGFRVPILLISPYVVKPGHVSHVKHEFGSILHFTEETFGTGNLGTTDATSDDLQDSFNYSQPARAFTPISAPAFTPSCNGHKTDEDP